MQVRRFRPGHLTRVWAVGLSLLIGIGCSQEPELKLDPGVSPFFPGETGSTQGPRRPARRHPKPP
jgi:hypothetical protein